MLFPEQLTHLTRPLTKAVLNFIIGFVHGFTNYNLDVPLYCILDAPGTFKAYLELDASYKKTGDADIYQNLYDAGLPL